MHDLETTVSAQRPQVGDYGQSLGLSATIAGLRPINRLPKHAVDNIVKQATLYQVSVGETIIERASDDKLIHYLIEGTVQIFKEDGASETLIAADPNAKNALSRYAKAAQDMVANCPSTLLRIPWETLEKYLIQYAPAELSSTLEVQEILSSTSSDWMVRLLQSDLFSLLPANNIQKVLGSIDFVDTLPEEIILTEGEQGEHFFIVDHGDFLVSKQNSKTGAEVELAHLSSGDFFGEEALITGAPRGATVTSVNNGRLIKINNDTFKNYIVAPAVPLLSADRAKSLVGKGATYLDIRAPDKISSGTIPNSDHVMLNLLRANHASLDKKHTYVVIDDTPAAAAHAAFLLRAKGYDARCLNLPLEKYAVLQGIDLTMMGTGDGEILNEAENDQATRDENTIFEHISQLAQSHANLPDHPADAADYAHTLTGEGLADLIEELNDAYDCDESIEGKQSTGVAEPATSPVNPEAGTESLNNGTTKISADYQVEYDDDDQCEITLDAYDYENQPPTKRILEALDQQRQALTTDFEHKLQAQKVVAQRAIRDYKIQLAKEHRQKQLALLENGKKLIALANKVSQQKAEIQRARLELSTQHTPGSSLGNSGEGLPMPDHASSLSPIGRPSANNDSWPSFLRTLKR